MEAAQPHVEGDRAVEFERVRARGWKGMFIAGSPLHQWFLDGGSPEDILVPPETIVRDGSRSRCARIERLDDAHPLPEPLFFKAYHRRPGAQAALKRMIGWHLPSWVWRTSWRLLEAGVPVPQPLGYLTSKSPSGGRSSYLWAEWIDSALPAVRFARMPDRRAEVVNCDTFAERSAELLAHLHDAGFFHRDLNWGNVLVEPTKHDVWLIDLDSTRRWTPNRHAAACRDVARFLMDAVTFGTSRQWQALMLDEYARLRGLSSGSLEQRVRPMMDEYFRRRKLRHPERMPQTLA